MCSWMANNAQFTGIKVQNWTKARISYSIEKEIQLEKKIARNTEEAFSWFNGMFNIPKHEQWEQNAKIWYACHEIASSQ